MSTILLEKPFLDFSVEEYRKFYTDNKINFEQNLRIKLNKFLEYYFQPNLKFLCETANLSYPIFIKFTKTQPMSMQYLLRLNYFLDNFSKYNAHNYFELSEEIEKYMEDYKLNVEMKLRNYISSLENSISGYSFAQKIGLKPTVIIGILKEYEEYQFTYDSLFKINSYLENVLDDRKDREF